MLEFVKNNWEIISAIVGLTFGGFQFFYCSNEKFYLFIKRKMLFFQKNTSVTLQSDISLTNDKEKDELLKVLRKEFNIKRDFIIESNADKGFLNFIVDIEKSPYNETKIFITIKKETTIEHLKRDIETIRREIQKIENKTDSKLSNIDINIIFTKNNPYESFFVKKLPFENIEDFSVKLRIDKTLIEAKKKKVIVRSRLLENALYQLEQIVTLQTPILLNR